MPSLCYVMLAWGKAGVSSTWLLDVPCHFRRSIRSTRLSSAFRPILKNSRTANGSTCDASLSTTALAQLIDDSWLDTAIRYVGYVAAIANSAVAKLFKPAGRRLTSVLGRAQIHPTSQQVRGSAIAMMNMHAFAPFFNCHSRHGMTSNVAVSARYPIFCMVRQQPRRHACDS